LYKQPSLIAENIDNYSEGSIIKNKQKRINMRLSTITILLLLNQTVFAGSETSSIDAQIAKIKNAPASERYLLVNELKKQIAQMNALQQAKAVTRYQEESLKAQQNAQIANDIHNINQINLEQQQQIITPVIDKPTRVIPLSLPNHTDQKPENPAPVSPTKKPVPTVKPTNIPTEPIKDIPTPVVKPTFTPSKTPKPEPIYTPKPTNIPKPVTQPVNKIPTPPAQPIKNIPKPPANEPAKINPTNIPISTPITQPTYKPVSKPTYIPTPVTQPIVKPTYKPTYTPVQKPVTQPKPKPTYTPVQKPVTQPKPVPTYTPVQKPVTQPKPAPTYTPAPSKKTSIPSAPSSSMGGF
jgi:hypothetical protein